MTPGEVWMRERDAPYEPTWGVAIYSTREKAEASVPEVTTWVPWGKDSWSEGGLDGMAVRWVITRMPLDPEETP